MGEQVSEGRHVGRGQGGAPDEEFLKLRKGGGRQGGEFFDGSAVEIEKLELGGASQSGEVGRGGGGVTEIESNHAG